MTPMKRLLTLIVLLIAYGSLFPFHFAARPLAGHPLMYLLGRWDTITNPYMIHDIAVNVVLYTPLGLIAHFAFRRRSLSGPVLLALAMAGTLEFIQIYEPGRQATMVDILADTAGATIGVVFGVLLRALPGPLPPRWQVNPIAPWAVLAGVAAFRLYPFHFSWLPGIWSWIPFGHLLSGNQEKGLFVLQRSSPRFRCRSGSSAGQAGASGRQRRWRAASSP